MAKHKNQHFVPRCYLKAFTSETRGQAINLYNIDRRQGIRNAAAKSQCSKGYFYGDDLRLEKLLQPLEGLYARTLRDLEQPGSQLSEAHKVVLRHFCYLQYCRTEAASRRAAEFTSGMVGAAFGDEVPEPWRVTMREAIRTGMIAFADTMRVVHDLKVCLIYNATKFEFVTSDDPAIMTNRWYIDNSSARGQSYGAGSAGVLFLLPLTPRILCILYDGDVYSLPHDGGWIRTKREEDVEALNQHQVMGCNANLYFHDWAQLPAIETACERATDRRPVSSHEVVVAVLEDDDGQHKSFRVVPLEELKREGEALIHVRAITSEPSSWPSVIKWRTNPKIYSNGSGTGFVRRWCLEDGFYQGDGYVRINARSR